MNARAPGGGQLPLALSRTPASRLADFVETGNEQLLATLQGLGGDTAVMPVLIWGPTGAGKSHLLTALCAEWTARGRPAACVTGGDPELDPAVLEGLERCELVCVDALEALVARPAWEEALFHLYNRLAASGRRLVLASARAPRALAFCLPDLGSRLVAGLVFQLRPLDDAGKLVMLGRRAAASGLELPAEVGRYLLTRLPRDTGALLQALERLDWASLAAGRRLTLPFVRAVLEAGD